MVDEIKSMKKIELHIHLDGSVLPSTLEKLTGRTEEDLRTDIVAKDKCENLSEYLTKFDLPISYMQTSENLTLIAKDLVDYFEREKVIYAEVRFAPMLHTREGLTYDEIISAVLEGLNSNPRVKTNLILCMMRGFSDDDNIKTIEATKRWLGKGVCALDLAGAEDKYSLRDYIHLFNIANHDNIPFIIHAGENGTADEVLLAVELGARRIGHGIHVIDDEKALAIARDKQVLLEICPTSNVQTNSVDNYENHPINSLFKSGIRVCINTDNKTVSNISLTEEYLKLQQTFNFSLEEFQKMNLDALEATFLSYEEKNVLRKVLEEKKF